VWRVGVDIGGTFTDGIAFDEESGQVKHAKSASTPPDFAAGVLAVVDGLISRGEGMSLFVHGTTVGLNSMLQGKITRLGLITTKGFRDVLELGRGNRVNIYDPLYQYPAPLIPRRLRFEVNERVDAGGAVLVPLMEEEVRQAASRLVAEGVDGIVVSFINSYVNPVHERVACDVIRSTFPGLAVVCSTDLTREYREYERTCTAVINLAISRDMKTYLTNLEEGLARRGYSGAVLVMQPSGGALSSALAKQKPVYTFGSTAAGGVIALETLADVLGIKDMIGADMGGTSFDVEVILDGRSRLMPFFKIKTPFSGADGYPVLVPTLDSHSIGAGGGSVAWADRGGLLHVGPQSMGADPGPACYGKGGDQPTVTDANVVLGTLNPEYLLGGQMPIYREYSEGAIAKLARQFGMGIREMAAGIIEIVCNNMAGAIRASTLRKGLDPRKMTMVAFGGAGPLHAVRIARYLDIRDVLVPQSPGTFSAWGMVMAPIKHDFVQTVVVPLDGADLRKLDRLTRELIEQGIQQLREEGIEEKNIGVVRTLDARYVGQERTLSIQLSDELARTGKEEIAARFDEEHRRVYLQSAPDEPKEIVNLRVSVIGRLRAPEFRRFEVAGSDPDPEACTGERYVFFNGKERLLTRVYNRELLRPGNELEGPALVEELTSTTALPPGASLRVDEYGNLRIKVAY